MIIINQDQNIPLGQQPESNENLENSILMKNKIYHYRILEFIGIIFILILSLTALSAISYGIYQTITNSRHYSFVQSKQEPNIPIFKQKPKSQKKLQQNNIQDQQINPLLLKIWKQKQLEKSIELQMFKQDNLLLTAQKFQLLTQQKTIDSSIYQQQIKYYQKKYKLTSNTDNLPHICISFINYKKFTKKSQIYYNLRGIFRQDYPIDKIHIVYIVTDQQIQREVYQNIPYQYTKDGWSLFEKNNNFTGNYIKDMFYLLKPKAQLNKLDLLMKIGIQICKPEHIFLPLDNQDDILIGTQVFKLIGNLFKSQSIGLIYSNYLTIQAKLGNSQAYPANTIQNQSYRNQHLRIKRLYAFYSGLLNHIDKKDLKDKNNISFVANIQAALLYPILDLLNGKFYYVEQLLYYLHSDLSPIYMFENQRQQKQEMIIRSYPRYKPINIQQFIKNGYQ